MRVTFRGIHADILADDTSEINVEGARYSGKTWLCCTRVIRTCLKFPGMLWLICRYTDQDTEKLLRPVFSQMLQREGVDARWRDADSCFEFPSIGAQTSRVYAHGLRAQTRELEMSKVRGLDKGGIWNDQSEELPQSLSEELRFGTRQPGNFPRQLLFSPNPCDENHYLTDQFPDECLVGNDPAKNLFPHRHYYRLSIYDNKHNLAPGKIAEIEAMYPPTHARYKSLVLGLRGVNINGNPVYAAFLREKHCLPSLATDETRVLYEAIQYGQHHPTWLVAQRNYWGGVSVLGGLMGKRMSLDEFLPIVKEYRARWFGEDARFKTCGDPPPDVGTARFTNLNILQDHGFAPTWRANANSPDVREAVIQSLTALMRKPRRDGFVVTTDPDRFLMSSKDVIKHSKFFVDGLESAYVWDPHMVSVGNKRVRQPKADEWTDGGQRCLENLYLNFCADGRSEFDRDHVNEASAETAPPPRRVSVWS